MEAVRVDGAMLRSRIHRSTWLAFRPLAKATPATEALGSKHAEATACLKASLCACAEAATIDESRAELLLVMT